MLCCLLLTMLLAQATVAIGHVRRRLGGVLTWRRGGAVLIAANLFVAGYVTLHWDHLARELRSSLGLPQAAPESQQICTAQESSSARTGPQGGAPSPDMSAPVAAVRNIASLALR